MSISRHIEDRATDDVMLFAVTLLGVYILWDSIISPALNSIGNALHQAGATAGAIATGIGSEFSPTGTQSFVGTGNATSIYDQDNPPPVMNTAGLRGLGALGSAGGQVFEAKRRSNGTYTIVRPRTRRK